MQAKADVAAGTPACANSGEPSPPGAASAVHRVVCSSGTYGAAVGSESLSAVRMHLLSAVRGACEDICRSIEICLPQAGKGPAPFTCNFRSLVTEPRTTNLASPATFGAVHGEMQLFSADHETTAIPAPPQACSIDSIVLEDCEDVSVPQERSCVSDQPFADAQGHQEALVASAEHARQHALEMEVPRREMRFSHIGSAGTNHPLLKVPATQGENPEGNEDRTKGDFFECLDQKRVFADATDMKRKVREAITRQPYDVRDFYWTDGRLSERIARSAPFDHTVLSVIFLNSIWIAVETDLNHAETLSEAHLAVQLVEHSFCAFFFWEWLVRFLAFQHKPNGLRDSWFVFDSFMVLLTVGDAWVMTLLLSVTQGRISWLGNAAVLKTVRVLRLTRMMRMVRLLRAVPELMILVKAITAAFRAVFFSICLLMIIVYVYAIAFARLCENSSVGDEYFPNVSAAMATLLLRGNLPDYFDIVDDISGGAIVWACLIMSFIVLAPLTVMGMLNGVLVEVVQVVASVEKEALVTSFIRDRMSKLLAEIDTDADSMVTRDEFQQLLLRKDVARMMNSVGVDVMGLAEFCDYLFKDADGQDTAKITFADVMQLVLQLRGTNQATVKDIVDLRRFMRQELQATVVSELHRMEARLLAKIPLLTFELQSSELDGHSLSSVRFWSSVAQVNQLYADFFRSSLEEDVPMVS
eukprot:TRINITY_DN40422_c0_g1_i1.p1 TRINITY_DN40422_c0_g1~~TRINITY_DN40422_c0_g1_i1.p1  ORF type:complete len:697 (+),score=123.46 TRINITY_DN40422_c0_g1_i1:149-2239(+)